MRILHAPANFGDQAGVVVRALKRAGYDAELWEYGRSKWGYPADRSIDVATEDPQQVWNVFLEALERFDVFHFHYARSFFYQSWTGVPPLWDLPVLRALGKKVFFTFVGSECRMRKIAEQHNPWASEVFKEYTPNDDRIAKTLQTIRTYADEMFVVSGEMLPYVPDATFMPRAVELGEWERTPALHRDVPVVLHVPSRRTLKGTDLIMAGLEQLRDEGVRFELRLLENIPHEEMKKAMRDADVVVDQLLLGDHGLTSVEAMLSGCVAVAYLTPEVRQTCSDMPIFDVDPTSFVDRMRVLLTDRELRVALAGRGYDWVAQHFDASRVARMHIERYEKPPRALPSRGFPDWTSFGDERRLERLEERLADVELDRKQLREKNTVLRDRVLSLGEEVKRLREMPVAQVVAQRAKRKLNRGR
ncbi:MAG TPA: hypothetical protein VM600_05665 [Actinomycetota bacterium]|nr:hypothetical protein [Actinomycetota bacterium]